jgi:hypothetical protein
MSVRTCDRCAFAAFFLIVFQILGFRAGFCLYALVSNLADFLIGPLLGQPAVPYVKERSDRMCQRRAFAIRLHGNDPAQFFQLRRKVSRREIVSIEQVSINAPLFTR